MNQNCPHILVLSDVNTTRGGKFYEASRALCESLAYDHGVWVVLQPYEVPGQPKTEGEWLDAAKCIAARYDGYISLGGIFDLPHEFYLSGQRPAVPEGVSWTPEKSRFPLDSALMQAFLQLDKPLLAVCGGMQVLAGTLGCKLGLVDGHWLTAQNHEISVQDKTLLAASLKDASVEVCSFHREHVVDISPSVTVSAVSAADGVVEAIEASGYTFAVGLQGHPEEHLSDPTSPWHRLIKAYVDATQKQIMPI